ncbi:glycosyltransferase family 2 protein [Holophaga foetida]|uniref:glycosyltransferase family 2 protein n=1 Tax=Holophaga foetida TaxID=35839 RepID=UPI0002473B46|nr:glycosyltransferase family 2 protein [Holophaga foetida]
MSVTAILIVKNEAKHLAACLETVKGWVDEIVVYDSGSTDATEEIAASFGARFIRDPDWQGFGKQRQKAQTHVKTGWCLWLDADERITPELKASIQAALASPAPDTVYALPRLTWAYGRFIRHCGWYPDHCLRLYPTAYTTFNAALVHENLERVPGMKVQPLKGDLLHFSYDTLEHHLTKAAKYASAWAEERARKGKRGSLSQALLHGSFRFLRMYVLRAGFMDGKAGLVLSILGGHAVFIKYVSLWMYDQPKRPD